MARAFARAATGPLGDFEGSFEAAVAERLAAKGWVLQPQIGVSGFRIDLASWIRMRPARSWRY